MSESKIVLALQAFKEAYAWDKSLLNPDVTYYVEPRAVLEEARKYEHSSTYLEDFLALSREK